MQDIIDTLNAQKAVCEQEIDANAKRYDELTREAVGLLAANERHEDKITALDAAIAVLGGKVKRRKSAKGHKP